MAEQVPVTLSFWKLGINSLLPPIELAKQQYAWGENIINRGGIVQTRPGRRPIASIKGKTPQGFTIFTPKGSTARLVAAVDGDIYTMAYPLFTPVKLEGVKMNSRASQVHFCTALKSIQRNPDESLKIIDPTPILMISDGLTPNACWDGKEARHLDTGAPAKEMPIGTWMVWIASRLWIASGTKIYVSDLSDPMSHTEAQYLSERDAFELPDVCTGLIGTTNQSGILAFTAKTTTAFKANERTRTVWSSLPGFQEQILQNVGCVAGRTACNQYGLTWWLSDKGLVNLDVAFNTARSSKLVTADEAMMRSRRKLSPDQSQACAMPWENLLFVAVPSGGRYNEHTWVMDQAAVGASQSAADNFAATSSGVWASVWTGNRPVQFAGGKVGGKERLYCLSFDKSAKDDTRIHVWEEMLPDRKDAGGRIKCQWITGVVGAADLLRFRFCRIQAVEILGEVSLDVFMAGTRGPWWPIGSFALQAEEGSIGSSIQPLIRVDSVLQEFKPQSRPLVTKEFVSDGKPVTSENRPYAPGVDRGFQLCFEWTGRMGVSEITIILGEGPKELHGAPACLGDGQTGEAGQHNAINASGEAVLQR